MSSLKTIFHIVTPSYNQLDWLKRCVASIADQATEGVAVDGCSSSDDKGASLESQELRNLTAKHTIRVHHHIQDAQSSDGTVEFLKEHQQVVSCELSAFSQGVAETPKAECRTPNAYSFSFQSERDPGMYDALNRGVDSCLRLAVDGLNRDEQTPGTPNSKLQTSSRDDSIVAWLNCDEQYLPDTLNFVAGYFEDHPEVDMLFGDYLIVDGSGELLAFRKGCVPRLRYIQASHLNNLSCAMFFRAEVFQKLGGFDPRFKAVADEDFVVRALKAGFRARHVQRYLSAFAFTSDNLGSSAVALREYRVMKSNVPPFIKWTKGFFRLAMWLEKFLSRTYFQRFPLSYSIHVHDSSVRKIFTVEHADWRWPLGDGGAISN